MNRQIRHNNGNSGKAPAKIARRGFKDYTLLNKEDSVIFKSISEYMKGRLDLEEVQNDPGLTQMDSVVKDMISDYNKNKTKNKNNEKFILDIFAGGVSEEKLLDEISHIKLEIDSTNVNDISAEWVKEWHEKRQKIGSPDPQTEEIRNFISGSLESEEMEYEEILTGKKKKALSRSLMVRYISLSAAAVFGVFMLVKTLVPSYDADKLFNSYYGPLNAVSPVTRGDNTNESAIYATAIENYKLGDYQTAATGFSSTLLRDSSVVAPRFFMGITQVALGNYDQAIRLLSEVSVRSGEYGKDARWYLGLAYLKNGEKDKASGCFKLLAQSSGYYHERSEKILRRLK